MPTYEYACKKCGIVEVFQSIREAPLTTCPTCRSKGLQRMVSLGAGVIFKGSGFWETDYNHGSGSEYQKKAKSEKPAEATPKPETKPEPKLQPTAAPAAAKPLAPTATT